MITPFTSSSVAILLCYLALFASGLDGISPDRDQDAWDLRRDRNGIKVYTRDYPGSAIKEYRAIMEVEAMPLALKSILDDVDSHHTWISRIDSSSILAFESKQKKQVYYVVDLPWPFQDRDLVMLSETRVDPETEDVVINLTDASDAVPVRTGYVRMTDVRGSWHFSPSGRDSTRVTYKFYGKDTGLPAWVVNLFIVQSPYETLTSLRNVIQNGS